MQSRPTGDDLRGIAGFLGRIFLVVGASASVPLVWAMVAAEWHPFGSLLLMTGVFGILGTAGMRLGNGAARLAWRHGLVVVALAWLVVPMIGAIPLYLSGHFGDPLDALFDAVSGLTTTGLSVMSDLDHLAGSLNLWRHVLQFMGGLGIVAAALTLFSGAGGIALYTGEGHGERFLPTATSMVRFFWAIALVQLLVVGGGLVLVTWWVLGFEPGRALLHGITMFFAGFSTGGFAPQSTGIAYYHSALFESVAALAMISGMMSFGLHHTLWRGHRRDALQNLETRSFLITFTLTVAITVGGLAAAHEFASALGLTHQSFFQVLSAHTTTGWATISATELAGWPGAAFGGMLIAMALGGMGSSTAGGIKAIRVGIVARSITDDVRHMVLPEGAVVSTRYRQGGNRRLTSDEARGVLTITLLFITLYAAGALVGFAYGIPLHLALFESVSATATVGLSVGVTGPAMPVPLEVVYTVQMWAGRLEFMALFALAGFAVSAVRGAR